jgi:hypothetical protein
MTMMNDDMPKQPPASDHQPSDDTPHLAHLREKLRSENLRRDRRSSEGIWYWTWLKPQWMLREFRATEFGKLTHEEAWSRHVVPEIAKHYKLRKSDADKLLPLHKSLPRGRVHRVKSMKLWLIMHGGDAPIPQQKAEMMLPSRFNLTKELLCGRVLFVLDSLRSMVPEEQSALKAILGRVPYRSESHD